MLPVFDAGILAYRPAWDLQLQLHDQVLAGTHPAGALMLVEHPPVITIGRRPGAPRHLLAAPEVLAARRVEVVETDRGGDITFHGPGQLVAYPIVPLNAYNFNLHTYMRFLEEVVIRTVAGFGVTAVRDPGPKPATGVWVDRCLESQVLSLEKQDILPQDARPMTQDLAKICALGIKVRRWVTLHGIALNVTTDLSYFELINPCGLSRPVTSLRQILREGCPTMEAVKGRFAEAFAKTLAEIRVTVAGAGRNAGG
jgi:lipoyl(octanoyl) transferase